MKAAFFEKDRPITPESINLAENSGSDNYDKICLDVKIKIQDFKEELDELQAEKTKLETGIRESEATIQDLNTRTTIIENLHTRRTRMKAIYNGWLRDQLGDPYRYESEEYDHYEDRVVPNEEVIHQIEHTQANLHSYRSSLKRVNSRIDEIDSEIADLNNKLEKLEISCESVKDQIDKQIKCREELEEERMVIRNTY